MDDDDATPDVLTALYRVVPNEFVAERNRLAKQLRGEGRRDVATAITALRRPPLADWALNQAVAIDGDAVSAYVATTAAVSAAQRSALDGDPPGDLRQLLKQMRTDAAAVVTAASEALAGAALTGVGSTPPELHARLAELATRPAGLEMLAAGVIGSRPDDGDADDPFAAFDTAPVATTARHRASKRMAAKATASKRAAPQRTAESAEVIDLAGRRELRNRVTAAKRDVESARSKRDAAERAAATPRRRLTAAEQAVVRAEEQLSKAVAARAEAAAVADAAERSVSAADEVLDAASAALAAAESQLAGD